MRQPRAAIVVGVDGTESARAALSFAMREANRRGGALGVVTAWTERPARAAEDVVAGRESDRARAQDVQDTAVANVLRGLATSPTLSRQVVEGEPAAVLLKLARTADYLVVGAGRHSHPDSTAPLGSVATSCVEAARCPVLVVHARSDGDDTAGYETARYETADYETAGYETARHDRAADERTPHDREVMA